MDAAGVHVLHDAELGCGVEVVEEKHVMEAFLFFFLLLLLLVGWFGV